MPKIVIFDGGFGGELFADYVENEVPIIEVIRVIDWRNADAYLQNPKLARKQALIALRPYINKVDVIVFANYLLSTSELKYFRRKFKKQKFIGFSLAWPARTKAESALILSTKALCRTHDYHTFVRQHKIKTDSVACDNWLPLIDDGELTKDTLTKTFSGLAEKPQLIILACTHFTDAILLLRKFFGASVTIKDGFDLALHDLCHELGLRGLSGKKIFK